MTDNRVAHYACVLRRLAGTAIFSRRPTGSAVFQRRLAGAAVFLQRSAGTAVFVTGLALAGCSKTEVFTGPTLRVYAADLAGAAKLCDAPKLIQPVAGGGAEAPLIVANDGGWCGIRVHREGPKPFDAGLLTTRPNHGTVLIHEVGDDTRIDYTPDRGFAGNDAFVVKLIPGNATIEVGVTVTPPGSKT